MLYFLRNNNSITPSFNEQRRVQIYQVQYEVPRRERRIRYSNNEIIRLERQFNNF